MFFDLKRILQIGLLCLSLVFIGTSCETAALDGEENGGETMLDAVPVSKEAQRNFYHAWLADCVNEEIDKHRDSSLLSFTALAKSRIQDAIADPAISGYFGKETLVWGPVVSVKKVKEFANKYTPDNLLYCVSRKDSSGREHYTVGIAGTNAISKYDWLTEDLDVQSQKAWPNGGEISNATNTGMQNLTGFTESGVTIDAFLQKEALSNPSMSVEVAGHSLGGAQTQTMASFLKGKLKPVNPKIPVSAWVYAGPTAGNDVFADSLVAQLDGYYAYHNTIDVVPHAWELQDLREICSLYVGFSVCENTIDTSLWVNGLIRSLIARSEKGTYTQPVSHVLPFTGQHYFSTDTTGCSVVLSGISSAWEASGFLTGLFKHLNELGGQCGHKAKITEPEFNQFMFFLTELGSQHTTAYYQHFLDGTPLFPILHKYVPSHSSDAVELDALDAFSAIVKSSYTYLSENNITDCSCQASSGE